jgi:hypothetical protein
VSDVKHFLLLSAALVGLIGASVPSQADEAPRNIFMDPHSGEIIVMPGLEDVTAIVDATTGMAFADVHVVQTLVGNTVTQEGGSMTVGFDGSGNALAGVLSVNQEAGNMNQQANVRSLAVALAGGGLGVVKVDINTLQVMQDNTLLLRNTGPREVSITNSFNNGTGIVGINQAAGNMNQQLTVVAVGIGLQVGPDVVQIGDSQLGQIGSETDNSITEEGVQGPRHNELSNSFNEFSGIAQISQTTGDMNRTTQVIGVSVTTVGAP